MAQERFLRGKIAQGATPTFQVFITESGFDNTRQFGLSVQGGLNPVTASWDFGDGNTSGLISPLHTYAAPGNYTVSVTVTDQAGNTATDTLEVIVTDESQPAVEDIVLWRANSDLSNPANIIKVLASVDTIDLEAPEASNGVGFQAQMLSNNAQILRVEFYENGTLAGTQAGSPYTHPGDLNNGSFFYIPAWQAGPGIYSIEARPFDINNVQGVSKTIQLTVLQNTAPVANNVSVSTANSTLVSIDLTNEVADADGTVDFSTLEIVGSPVEGTAVLNGNAIDFTPTGTDIVGSVQYRVQDNQGKLSNVATITVEIGNFHEAPQLADFSVQIPVDVPTAVDVAGRAVDSVDGIDVSSVQIEAQPAANATVSLGTGADLGKVIVDPTDGFIGTVSFTVSVADANPSPKRSPIATVVVQVGELQVVNLFGEPGGDRYQKPVFGEFRYQVLAPTDLPDWEAIRDKNANGPIVAIPLGSSPADAQSIINGAAAGSIIRFETGNYNWTNPTVTINQSDRRIEIPAGVVINVNYTIGGNRPCFQILGGGVTGSSSSFTAQDYLFGKEVTLPDASAFQVGDWLLIDIPFINKTYSSANTWNLPNGVEANRKGTVTQIVGKSGNTLTLDRRLAMPPEWNDYPQYATLQKINLVSDVVIEGKGEISYTAWLGTTVNYTSNGNFQDPWKGFGLSTFRVDNTLRCSVQGIIARDTPGNYLTVVRSSHTYINDIEYLGCHNTGGGGTGYDIACEGVSVFLFENLYTIRTRHGAPATSLIRGVTCGHVHYRYLSTNIDYHGAGDWGVTVVVDELNYWHDSTGFRLTDYRSRQTLNWNHAWIKNVTNGNRGHYDQIFSTLGNGDYDFQSVPVSQHDPGFRIFPDGKYNNDVGFNVSGGHMTSWIIGTTGPSSYTLNPGVGRLRQAGVYGGCFIVGDPGGKTLQRTIANFKLSNSHKSPLGNVILLCTGTHGATDFTSAYALMSDVGGNTRLDLGGGNYVELEGITKNQITEEHLKVVDEAILKYWQGHNYFRHLFYQDRPYLRSVSPAIATINAGTGAEVSHTFNRPVTHNAGAGDAFLLNQDGTVFRTINPATDFTISGNKVTYSFAGLQAGSYYRFEIPPNYFQDSSNRGIFPIYDWDWRDRPPTPFRNLHYWQA